MARNLEDETRRPAELWDHLGDQVGHVGGLDCDIRLLPTGSAIPLRLLQVATLRRLLAQGGFPAGTRDSMIAALGDWTDGDDLVRPGGAESAWYSEAGRIPPSNRPLASPEELLQVRGFERAAPLVGALTSDSFRVSLRYAPEYVLRSLPGVGDDVARAIVRRRNFDTPIDLHEIAGDLASAPRDSLESAIPFLEEQTTDHVDGWLVNSRAASEGGGPVVVVEVLFARASREAIPRRRRIWIE